MPKFPCGTRPMREDSPEVDKRCRQRYGVCSLELEEYPHDNFLDSLSPVAPYFLQVYNSASSTPYFVEAGFGPSFVRSFSMCNLPEFHISSR